MSMPGPNMPMPGPDTITAARRCQYCGKPAEVFDVDGEWCTPEHQRYDRQSETTYWRKAVEA